MHKDTFKAIKWYTGDSYYDANSDYLHILSNKAWLNRIIQSYILWLSCQTIEPDQEMLQKC